ncbi:MAG: zinc-binding dehydrogenase [Chloroflexota bacterium]
MKGVAKVAPGEGNVELIDVAEPEATAGHVVLEVKTAGVCGTDLHIYHDEYPSNPPVIMGHEVAGIVADIGNNVSRCRTGDRVTSETYFHVCGSCTLCRDGFPNQCPERKSIGSGVHGAFTKYVLVPEQNIHHLPENVDVTAGALTEPLACCVHALELTRVEPDETVVVTGPGAIGLLTSQVVKAAGAKVIVIGTSADEARLELATSLGADLTLNAQAVDVQAIIHEMTDRLGADVVFECSGAGPAAQTCLDLVRRKGRYAQVGLFGKPIQWDLEQVCFKEVEVSGSFATVPSAWRKALKMMASGKVQTKPIISDSMPITAWQQAFDTFERRDGVKIVLTPEA